MLDLYVDVLGLMMYAILEGDKITLNDMIQVQIQEGLDAFLVPSVDISDIRRSTTIDVYIRTLD
jgi:hypothetical protein